MNPPAIDVAQRLFNPFVGLRPFEESEAHLFFGRDGKATRSSTASRKDASSQS
jgi:hypothetical protein